MTLGVTLSRRVCVHRISLGGEGNALYPVLSISYYVVYLSLLTVSIVSLVLGIEFYGLGLGLGLGILIFFTTLPKWSSG